MGIVSVTNRKIRIAVLALISEHRQLESFCRRDGRKATLGVAEWINRESNGRSLKWRVLSRLRRRVKTVGIQGDGLSGPIEAGPTVQTRQNITEPIITEIEDGQGFEQAGVPELVIPDTDYVETGVELVQGMVDAQAILAISEEGSEEGSRELIVENQLVKLRGGVVMLREADLHHYSWNLLRQKGQYWRLAFHAYQSPMSLEEEKANQLPEEEEEGDKNY
ncbi:hypothetical protein COLO4_25873 [Corchorus olitorius]|uniref:Uncharacterized protein n=1 Tax=Corchorus olitorius TaxID=93759 RepID=A0A1R3HZM6_9ROSI|nr:hypothetical protein COLO4_25873 [Corchorus olitorius]